MPSIASVAAASALVALGSALPAEQQKRSLSAGFQVKQVYNPHYVHARSSLVDKSVKKWSAVASAQAAGQTGSVSATPQPQDSEYLCPVKIGDQTFTLDFDTGSSDTWVFGSQLENQAGGGSHTYYTPSSTAKKISGASWSISYGDGSSASGEVYTDTVDIGGVTVTGQAVEPASTASSEFLQGANDGLVGLAWDSINTVTPTKQKTFVTNAQAQGMTGVFVANLLPGAPGTYDFGYIDPAYGEISYTPVTNSGGFWAFSPDSAEFGGQTYSFTSDTGNSQPIADTGTTLLIADTALATAYYKGVSGATAGSDGSYTFPCSSASDLTDLTINIGSYKAVVPAADLNLGQADANDTTTCFGGLMGNAQFQGLNIFGDVFLKSQIVVFDAANVQLGFAPKPGSSSGGGGSPTSAPPTPTTAPATHKPSPTTAKTTGKPTPVPTTFKTKHHTTTTPPAPTPTDGGDGGDCDCDFDPFQECCFFGGDDGDDGGDLFGGFF